MKPAQDERSQQRIVGRALLTKQGLPGDAERAVGRATAALVELKKYLVGAKNEALEKRREEGPSLDNRIQILTADRALNALADLTREFLQLETEETRAANDRIQRQRGEAGHA